MKIAHLKLKRLDGLVVHAKFHINTGRLEGFNNKIKVTKRNATVSEISTFALLIFALFRSISKPKPYGAHLFCDEPF